MKIEIEIDDGVYSELKYMAKLLSKDGDREEFETVEGIIDYALSSVADGSRRPGAWEREMIQSMGMVSNQDEHYVYRRTYGEPEAAA